MKRLDVSNALLIGWSLFVLIQARPISVAFEKTKLTSAQRTGAIQFILYQKFNSEKYSEAIQKLIAKSRLEPNLDTDSAQIDKLIANPAVRSQIFGLLLHIAQVTSKLDRAYSHTKTRSLINSSRSDIRLRDSAIALQPSH